MDDGWERSLWGWAGDGSQMYGDEAGTGKILWDVLGMGLISITVSLFSLYQ